MFSSKTPRDLNHDPCSWRHTPPYGSEILEQRFTSRGLGLAMAQGTLVTHDPRPEFDHPQHNEPNPILVDFRKWAPRDEWPDVSEAAELYLLHGVINGWPIATREEREHAFRVLKRLAPKEGAS